MPEGQKRVEWLDSVLLRHEVPGSGAHVDWMIAPAGRASVDDRVLLTWRLDEAIGRALAGTGGPVGDFEAVRIADHRYSYLDYEGEVSGGRGTVLRIASGRVRIIEHSPLHFEADANFAGLLRLEGKRVGDAPMPEDAGGPPLGLWRFRSVTRSAEGG